MDENKTPQPLQIEPEKFKLEREVTEKEKLRIFFMFVRQGNIAPIGEQIGREIKTKT